MSAPLPSPMLPISQAALRIVAGLAFFTHGAQKLFGWFGASGTVELMSRFGAAGVIEVVAGVLIAVGLFTRLAAFVAAGEMAVAYLWVHALGGGLFWWGNQGELAMLYAFIFLLFAAWGPGPLSLDETMARRARERAAAR